MQSQFQRRLQQLFALLVFDVAMDNIFSDGSCCANIVRA
jgi:hypothetical protein